ncbi:VOC family protein [Halioglobus maricola]|nr:VOC family protein [Halioglobus maricola]
MSEEKKKIVPAYMAHIVFQTKRYKEMVDWYTTVFHAEPMFANEKLTFMTYDDEHHRFAFVNMPPECPDKDPMSPAVAHYAYTYGSADDLLSTYERLKGEGIVPRWAINHWITTSLYYADPDGTEVELQLDNHPTPEESKAVFSSEAYLANPIGNAFDPDTLLQQFRAGKDYAQCLREAEAAADPSALPVV